MNRRELIRYICTGGLRLYDSESSIRWHNMSADERADWFVFFDMCRDEAGYYTEATIAAIMQGLCPIKAEVVHCHSNPWSYEYAEKMPEKMWYFQHGSAFGVSPPTVPERELAFTHFLVRNHGSYSPRARTFCVAAEAFSGSMRFYFQRHGTRAYVFKHPAHAWSFLLSYL